jgi:hypothetical protein
MIDKVYMEAAKLIRASERSDTLKEVAGLARKRRKDWGDVGNLVLENFAQELERMAVE